MNPSIPTPNIPTVISQDVVIEDLKIKKIKKKGEFVPTSVLADLFGVSTTTILAWKKAGMPYHETAKGMRFNSSECITWRITTGENLVRESLEPLIPEETMSLEEARRRKEAALALTAELELEKRRERVANIEDLMNIFKDALVGVRAKLVGMPNRVSGILSHQESSEITRILDLEIKDMLIGLSDYDG